jgi:hypothetical protein
MRRTLLVRGFAVVLGIAAFMPWYSSQALVDQDTYLGNPLPWIDWILLLEAVTTVLRPQLASVAAVIGLVDVSLGALLMFADAAEGLAVSLLPGLPLALVAAACLLVAHQRLSRRNE